MFKPSKYTLKLLKPIALTAFAFLFLSDIVVGVPVIVDTKHRRIPVTQPYKRIISLYGAHTENLFYLGLNKEVIGVSINDNFPPGVLEKKKYSYHDDPEKFLAAAPDLVLIRPMIDNGYPALVRQLERYSITVVSLQPRNVDEMFAYWLTLGILTGKTQEASHMVTDFKTKVSRIQTLAGSIAAPKKVYFEAIHTRMKTFTNESMAIYALEMAGGINIAGDAVASRNTNIANYGKERILAKADHIDVFLAQKGLMNPVHVDMIRNEPGFSLIKAVKNNQIFLIDEHIVSRPVPRLLLGIVSIGKILYPNIFTTIESQ